MIPSSQLLTRLSIGTIYVAKDWQTQPQLQPQVADELAFLVIISTAKIFFFKVKLGRFILQFPLWNGRIDLTAPKLKVLVGVFVSLAMRKEMRM